MSCSGAALLTLLVEIAPRSLPKRITSWSSRNSPPTNPSPAACFPRAALPPAAAPSLDRPPSPSVRAKDRQHMPVQLAKHLV
eukprot:scaffold7059_cov250-Pinguiococcus_pyrenoidosus.AAC.23